MILFDSGRQFSGRNPNGACSRTVLDKRIEVRPYWGLCYLFNVFCDRGLVDQFPYVASHISDLSSLCKSDAQSMVA